MGHIGLAIGFVRELNDDFVCVSLDQPLRETLPDGEGGEIATANVTFRFLHDLHLSLLNTVNVSRIDKDELTSGMSTLRLNLLSLFLTTGDVRLRRSIVDLGGMRCQ